MDSESTWAAMMLLACSANVSEYIYGCSTTSENGYSAIRFVEKRADTMLRQYQDRRHNLERAR